MKALVVTLIVVMCAVPVRAELRRVELKTLGMD